MCFELNMNIHNLDKFLYKTYTGWAWMSLLIAILIGIMCPRELGATPHSKGAQADQITRIVSLAPAVTEVLFYIGAEALLVGRTDACDFPAKAATIPSVGTMFPPNVEMILKMNPQLVVMSSGFDSLRDRLIRHKIKVYVFQPQTLMEISDEMNKLGIILNRAKSANLAARKFRVRLNDLKKKTSSTLQPIFWEIWNKPLMTVGGKNFINDLIKSAGALNIFADQDQSWPRINEEEIILRQPHWVITTDRSEDLFSERRWLKSLNFDQSKLLRIQNQDLVHRPSPRILDGLEWLITTLGKGS